MADFVAVLRKTISGLGENTPQMREKVYDKARATIEAKLAALNPPPPEAVIERQRKALEDAIAVVRADYAVPEEPEQDDGLEDVFASLNTPGEKPSPSVRLDEEPKVEAKPAPVPPGTNGNGAAIEKSSAPDISVGRSAAFDPANDIDDPSPDADMQGPTERRDMPMAADPLAGDRPRRPVTEKGGRRVGMLVGALVALVALGGAGYALWMNRDALTGPGAGQVAQDTPAPASGEAASPAQEPPAQETAAAPAANTGQEGAEAPAAEPAAPDDQRKFTQRLMPDGSETDEGPAGGQPTIGEGTSIAALAERAEGAEPPASGEQGAQAGAQQNGGEASPATIPVGQRAIFYEERTSSVEGSADMGTIVWSVVQESPGGNLPPEPAIRAEASIPAKDVQLRMTIRRNGDQSLPASHIIEMIFLTPEGFEGGGIASVSRISFKETEQAAGNPLIGIPAKIADGFFLIALGNAPAEVEANTTLLRRQSWIDIPITYASGRRALLTLEKGIPGDRIFQEALQAWQQGSSG